MRNLFYWFTLVARIRHRFESGHDNYTISSARSTNPRCHSIFQAHASWFIHKAVRDLYPQLFNGFPIENHNNKA